MTEIKPFSADQMEIIRRINDSHDVEDILSHKSYGIYRINIKIFL